MGRRAWSHLKPLLLMAPKPLLSPPPPPPPPQSLLPTKTPPFLRFLSTNSALSDVYESTSFIARHQQQSYRNDSEEEEELARYIPVKAYFLSTSIDLKSMQAENPSNVIPATSRSSNYVALQYSDCPLEITDIGLKETKDGSRYMVVFQYGSAVLFNIADHEAEEYLNVVRKYASGLLPEMRKDDYAVVEKPLLVTWMQGGADYIVLKNLDMDGIRMIGSVLGQSIALDHYIRQVDDMVEEFTDINRGMEKTGTFTMQRKKLFQLVGKANSNLADVIIKLGLFDRAGQLDASHNLI